VTAKSVRVTAKPVRVTTKISLFVDSGLTFTTVSHVLTALV
jgi:hypothetical protein